MFIFLILRNFLFLNIISSRPNSSSVGMNLEERQRQLLMKKKEIEESTLESSSRSLGLLYESEKVGSTTVEELNRQKETLLKTEGRLDKINNTPNYVISMNKKK